MFLRLCIFLFYGTGRILVMPSAFDAQRQLMGWQMMDVSALADLGVPWREASFLFNPRLNVRPTTLCPGAPASFEFYSLIHYPPLLLLAFLQLPSDLRIGHTLVSADRMRVLTLMNLLRTQRLLMARFQNIFCTNHCRSDRWSMEKKIQAAVHTSTHLL